MTVKKCVLSVSPRRRAETMKGFCMRMVRQLVATAFVLTTSFTVSAAATRAETKAYDRPEYTAIMHRLARGWNTWNSSNVLEQVLLPEGLAVRLSFKSDALGYLDRALLGPIGPVASGQQAEWSRPGLHALDGRYSELELELKGADIKVETGADGDQLVMLITPLNTVDSSLEAVISLGMLWNRRGLLSRTSSSLQAKLPYRQIRVCTTTTSNSDPYVRADTPYLTLNLREPLGVSTGKALTVSQIRSILDAKRASVEKRASQFGELARTYEAIESGLAWNTIYEPMHDRVITTVSRRWNEGSKGYVEFGWDNFFLAYASSLFSRDLAEANFAEHMRSMTPDGFIANVDQANPSDPMTYDRSQPPVGSLMLKEIYKRYHDRWLLEASFDDLLRWNRWWPQHRRNGQLLSYGSDPASNHDQHTKQAAMYESGMDDSPMYADVPFNPATNILELEDVGLTSLYIADSKALAEIADVLGKTAEAKELRTRAATFSTALDTLWDSDTGLYLNRHSDTGQPSTRISPTNFYPLLAHVPSPARAETMIQKHLLNPAEFEGDFILPSIARNDPTFPQQAYWRGAIWPPLNFLVYLGLRNYNLPAARHELVTKSRQMFDGEWKHKGFISENYSAITGTGDDPHLSSTPDYAWGVLIGVISFVESGELPAPEAPIQNPARSEQVLQ